MNIDEIPANINGMKLKKLLCENNEFKVKLEQMLKENPAYGTIKNLIWCLQNILHYLYLHILLF